MSVGHICNMQCILIRIIYILLLIICHSTQSSITSWSMHELHRRENISICPKFWWNVCLKSLESGFKIQKFPSSWGGKSPSDSPYAREMITKLRLIFSLFYFIKSLFRKYKILCTIPVIGRSVFRIRYRYVHFEP